MEIDKSLRYSDMIGGSQVPDLPQKIRGWALGNCQSEFPVRNLTEIENRIS
jgi:hypothetical protein